ncbi:MAG: gp58-like family protein [Methylorubrum extorquens]|jgi:hypothetical protein|uniref:host specificity factor TipJ family phage tail protein n=1 Tax=Methylorubrum extorquens TaxID=408 RepID=UPI002FEE4710
MTLVVTANIAGQPRGEPVRLPDRRRRRLSTIVARHKPPAGRRFIVSVHRKGETFLRPTDGSVRLRAKWSRTLVGPDDVVLVTVVPGRGGVGSIGLAIASIALIAVAPYAAPALAGVLGGAVSVGAVQAGLVIGGVALGYAAQASAAAKKKTERSLYSVTGGGNVPKPGARKPLLYGRCWSTPPLSQKDFITYDGDTMVLTKRMTLGIGRFQIHAVHVGEAAFWLESGGIQAPFTSTDGTFATQVEFLYGQPSTIAPGDVISSPSVGGQEMPRPGGNPEWTPWFRLTPQGVTADAAQMSWTYPAIYRMSSQGRQAPTVAGVIFQAREINPNTGAVIGPEFVLHNSSEGATALTTTPLRRSAYVRLPKNGAFQVRAQNAWPEAVGFEQKNAASWDEMAAIKDDVRIRPNTTEIVMRVRAGKGLTVTAFSEIWVDATRIIPVWNGSAWVEQAERKAVWAFADLVRSQHGLALPNGFDQPKASYYHNLLNANDTFDGALPEVSSFWEAASEVLLPLRADPVKVGPVHSFVRDESRAEPRHILSRRQIVRDSAGATFKTKVEGGDVIVEFDRDGDPRRPDEVRFSYGPATRTPKRYRVNGIRDGLHALKHATWLAAIAVFRGAERRITTEWDGRLVFPGDHVLSDLWFLKGKRTFGVASASGNMLTLDVTANVSPEWGYGSIRTREGREWGILRMRGVGSRGLELHPDDVTALAARVHQTPSGPVRLRLTDVLARDSQGPTTVVIGELVELQETYVARSAIPSDSDHVQIEMVADDFRVWQLLDEQVIAPAPVNIDNLAEPLIPQISVLHARCERIETGIEVVWGVSPTRGARNYEADISYDAGGTWEVLSPYGPASSGRAQMRQSDQPVTVRARAFGRSGLPGDYVSTTFTTVAPVVRGELLDDLSITIDKLSAETKKAIEDINALGAGALAMGSDATELALSMARDTIRGAQRQLAAYIEQMAEAQATQELHSYEQRQLIKVGNSANYAAILRTERAMIEADQALAEITTALDVRLVDAQTALVGQATALDQLTARVTVNEEGITATAQRTTALESTVNNPTTGVSATATAVDTLKTTVTTQGQNITATSNRTTALESTVNNPTTGVTATASALDTLKTTVTQQGGSLTSTAERTTALESTVNNATTGVTATATGLSTLKTTVSQQGETLTSTSQQLTNLSNEVRNPATGLSATAQAVDVLETQVNDSTNGLTALAQRVSTLNTTVGGHSSSITSLFGSYDGVKVQFGVTGTIDGQTGGFVLKGIKKLDGSVSYSMLIDADVFARSITSPLLQTTKLIATSAQIGNLIVDNIHVKDGGISSMVSNFADAKQVSASITVRTGGKIRISMSRSGNAGVRYAPALGYTSGNFQLRRNGFLIYEAPAAVAFQWDPQAGGNYLVVIASTMMVDDTPGPGTHTYELTDTNNTPVAGVYILVQESK